MFRWQSWGWLICWFPSVMFSISRRSFWPQSACLHRNRRSQAFLARAQFQWYQYFTFTWFLDRPWGSTKQGPWILGFQRHQLPSVSVRLCILLRAWVWTVHQGLGSFWIFGGKSNPAHIESWLYEYCRKLCFRRRPCFKRWRDRFSVFLRQLFFQTCCPRGEFWQK